jgi:hypothetical protein
MKCTCKPGKSRDNCPQCEGTGQRIDFAAIRRGESMPRTAHHALPGDPDNLKPAGTSGRYRTADGRAMIEWELKEGENGLEFSACGEFAGGSGQCIDAIAEAFPQDEKVQRIARVWEAYHLNGMNAGIPAQTRALEAAKLRAVNQALKMENPGRFFYNLERRELNPHTLGTVAGLKDSSYYAWAVHVLKLARLYEVPIHQEIRFGTLKATGDFPPEVVTGARGYRYGERWVFNPIPADVLAEIRSWSDFGPDDGKSLGDHQSAEFLERNGIACRITLSDSKPAQWEPAGHHYRVTLSKKGRQRLAFDYWGSAADASAGKEPTPHSVLSCIASDIYTPETFEEYCSEYGDDPDSRKALQTFNRAHRHAVKLREFFTDAERNELQTLR